MRLSEQYTKSKSTKGQNRCAKRHGASMKLSFVAADVNLTSEGMPLFAWMFVWTLIPLFFFPVFGWRPTPLKSMLENKVTVVESIICSLIIQLDDGFFRLSDKMATFVHGYL